MTIQVDNGAVLMTKPLRLELARRAAGYTQAQLGDAIEMSVGTVKRAENGTGPLKRPLLAAWAMATGVSVQWLETGEAPAGDPDGGHVVRHQGLEPRTR
ncbi:helix-turn-helix transcriptional regulator [Aeromicrobium sp. 9AM]|uniref:helix-turn-helix domain-containing protein n=1 Tax=Aeromicrobium sp. 9AM TaxID=2653126 RepID=UPI0012EFC6C9|nr:helix-turn-helix transcriptional regulator [Aeromicrobium sp. 9AM]VXC20761.1 HTH family transcriptional regulator [Aeromicrobium sp. 9AM]